MLKSKIFKFSEFELEEDIERFRTFKKQEVSYLECNAYTFNIWTSSYNLHIPIIFKAEDKKENIVGWFKGIPIKINQKLDDGTVNIN